MIELECTWDHIALSLTLYILYLYDFIAIRERVYRYLYGASAFARPEERLRALIHAFGAAEGCTKQPNNEN